MALKAVGEVAVHFGNFRNVDLFYQGLYHLRCRVYPGVVSPDDPAAAGAGASGGTAGAAAARALRPRLFEDGAPPGAGAAVDPRHGEGALRSEGARLERITELSGVGSICIGGGDAAAGGGSGARSCAENAQVAVSNEKGGAPTREGAQRPLDPEKAVLRACVVEEEAALRTKTVLIRYCEEEVDLNSLGIFRFEQDAFEPEQPLTLEVTLMFADAMKHTVGLLGDRFDKKLLAGIPLSEYKEASKQTFRLHSVFPSMQAYCPVVFDEFHFCRVDMVVRTSVLDFRLCFPLLAEPTAMPPGGQSPRARSSMPATPRGGDDGGYCGSKHCSKSCDSGPGPLAVRPALAACGMRWDASGVPPRRRGTAAVVEEALLNLAGHVPADPSASSSSPTRRGANEAPRVTWTGAQDRIYCGRQVGKRSYHKGPRRWCKGKDCTCDGNCGPTNGCQCRDCYMDTYSAKQAPMGLTEAFDILQREFVGRLTTAHNRLSARIAQEPKRGEDAALQSLRLPGAWLGSSSASPEVAPSKQPAPSSRLAAILKASASAGRPGSPIAAPGSPKAALGVSPEGSSSPRSLACSPLETAPAPVSSTSKATTSPSLAAAQLLAEDLSFVSAQVSKAWSHQLSLAVRAPAAARCEGLRGEWRRHQQRHWAENSFRVTLPVSEISAKSKEATWAVHARMASVCRSGRAASSAAAAGDAQGGADAGHCGIRQHLVEDLSVAMPQSSHNVLFEQRYSGLIGANGSGGATDPDDTPSGQENGASREYMRGTLAEAPTPKWTGSSNTTMPQRRGSHVFILVHGFQGQAFDMRLLRNNLALLYPKAVFLCSTANENNTEVEVEQMGARLAEEVREFVQDYCPNAPQTRLGRLSFVCHSIGGLVARAALPLLAEFQEKFFTFVSFSSPHLGYVYTSNTLFRTGFWLVTKLRQAKCLEQLAMADHPEPSKCFLSRLSKQQGLEHFQNVVLVSSYQDHYAPYESARIESSPSSGDDTKFGAVYEAMVQALLGRLEPERLMRVDFNLEIPETSLDTMIGRAAHIQFIECQILMRMFFQSYNYLFE